MAGRIIRDGPEGGEAQLFVEARGLEGAGVQPQSGAAPLSGDLFHLLQQFRAQSLAPVSFRNHKQVHIEPARDGGAPQPAGDDATLRIAQSDRQRFGLDRPHLAFIEGPEGPEDGVSQSRIGAFININLKRGLFHDAAARCQKDGCFQVSGRSGLVAVRMAMASAPSAPLAFRASYRRRYSLSLISGFSASKAVL